MRSPSGSLFLISHMIDGNTVLDMRTICDMGVGGPGLTPVELGGHGPGVLCPGPDL